MKIPLEPGPERPLAGRDGERRGGECMYVCAGCFFLARGGAHRYEIRSRAFIKDPPLSLVLPAKKASRVQTEQG